MIWLLGIITFIFTFMAIMSMGLFILSCIRGVVNPQVAMIDGKLRDKNENSRYIFLLITSIAWGIVIALP